MSEHHPRGDAPEPSSCDTVRLELGAYVLEGLDPAEVATVEAHLATCPSCSAEVEDLAELPGLLALADDTPPDVPPDLRDRTVARATRHPDARQRHRRTAALVAAVAALVGALLGAGGVLVVERDPPPDEVLALTDAPVEGRVALRDTPSGMDVELNATGLPTLEEGYYQVWLEWPSGHQVSAGTFVPDSRGRVDATLRTGGWRDDYHALEIRAHDRDRPDGETVTRLGLD